MKKLNLVSILLAVAYCASTVLGPSLHLLASHAHAGEPSCAAALEEFCGGAENPCSRPDHDHAGDGHSHKVCFLCKASSVSSIHALASENSFPTDIPSQIILEAVSHFRFEIDLLSGNPRGPPVFLA